MTSRFEDARWAQFDQPMLLDDCEPAWAGNAVPRHPYDRYIPDSGSERVWGPVENCITDLADYRPSVSESN